LTNLQKVDFESIAKDAREHAKSTCNKSKKEFESKMDFKNIKGMFFRDLGFVIVSFLLMLLLASFDGNSYQSTIGILVLVFLVFSLKLLITIIKLLIPKNTKSNLSENRYNNELEAKYNELKLLYYKNQVLITKNHIENVRNVDVVSADGKSEDEAKNKILKKAYENKADVIMDYEIQQNIVSDVHTEKFSKNKVVTSKQISYFITATLGKVEDIKD
jgi:hypothetical protein